MTRDELKNRVDAILGMTSEVVDGSMSAELIYKSPTGVCLLIVLLDEDHRDGSCRIGGMGCPNGELRDVIWQPLNEQCRRSVRN